MLSFFLLQLFLHCPNQLCGHSWPCVPLKSFCKLSHSLHHKHAVAIISWIFWIPQSEHRCSLRKVFCRQLLGNAPWAGGTLLSPADGESFGPECVRTARHTPVGHVPDIHLFPEYTAQACFLGARRLREASGCPLRDRTDEASCAGHNRQGQGSLFCSTPLIFLG